MLKKVAVVGAAGLLTAAVLTQTKLGDVAWNWVDRAERHLESKISPEEEIRMIKKGVKALDKDIEKAKGDLAEENVEVRHLSQRVAELKSNLEKSRMAVEARGDLVREGSETSPIKWDGRFISYNRAKEMLAAEVRAYKNLDKEYKAQETMLAVHERMRTLADQHLQALVAQKAELEVAVTELEADIKLAKIEQVESKYQDDGTRMANVKEALAKLRKRIEVQREKHYLTRKIDPKSVENKSVDEILADLDTASTGDQVGRR